MNQTVGWLQEALGEYTTSYWGEGVFITTTYPNPFPITMSSMVLGGSVGNGIAYDPNGQITRIDPGTTTPTSFIVPTADLTNPRWDLLVIQYVQTGDTPIPKPSDPISTTDLNLHDDFALVVREGVASPSPAYPAKQPGDIILCGLRVPANATLGTQITVDLSIQEQATANIASLPVFKQEIPSGTVNGSNANFTLSLPPINAYSVLVLLDGEAQEQALWTITGQVISFATAPSVGQLVYVYYVVNQPMSQNPLSGYQETPTGASNGTNATFVLSGHPADQRSTLVFVDGLPSEATNWSLLTGATSKIVFSSGAIPSTGQSVYAVSYTHLTLPTILRV